MQFIRLKYYWLIVLFLVIGGSVYSQDYQRAIKVKGFPGFGVSYKHLTAFEKGYELSIHTTDEWDSFTYLRISQVPAFPKISNKWFLCYGYGAHISRYRSLSIYNPFKPFGAPRRYNWPFVSPGFDGLIGFEYRMLKNPFVVSVDINTNFEFFGPDYFRVSAYNTVGIAYVF
jgi:hypothetical protein